MPSTDPRANWVLQCRPGFEVECLEEVRAHSGADGEPLSGAVSVRTEREPPPLAELVFARQSFKEVAALRDLPPGDRINPILAALAPHAGLVNAVLLENPDTNEGKELAAFFRRFESPLRSALAKKGLPLRRDASRRLHLLFTDSRRVEFQTLIPDVKPGTHSVGVRAVDAAGNSVTRAALVNVPGR